MASFKTEAYSILDDLTMIILGMCLAATLIICTVGFIGFTGNAVIYAGSTNGISNAAWGFSIGILAVASAERLFYILQLAEKKPKPNETT